MLASFNRPSCSVPYDYRFVFPLERTYWNSRAVHAFILRYWFWSIPLAFGYVVVIHALQFYMRNRKPFKLSGPLMAWNAALSLFSFFGTIRTGEELWNVMEKRGLHDTLCYTYGECPRSSRPPLTRRSFRSEWNCLVVELPFHCEQGRGTFRHDLHCSAVCSLQLR